MQSVDMHSKLLLLNIFAVCACFILNASFATSNPAKRSMGGSAEAKKWLAELEPELSRQCALSYEADWKKGVNITPETEAESVNAGAEFAKYLRGIQQKILKDFPTWETYPDEQLKRELKILVISGPGSLTQADLYEMKKLGDEMISAYSKATVCEYKNPNNCDLNIDPDIDTAMKESTDYDELEYYFTAWHDSASKAIPASKYAQYVNLLKKASIANGFKTTTDEWLFRYDDGCPGWTPQKFLDDMEEIWIQIRPYYDKLYRFLRMKLRADSPFKDRIPKCGKIPIHITGNMHGQVWTKLEEWARPFPKAPSMDITPLMKKNGYTVEKMFQVADEFFRGIGLPKLSNDFWNKSVLKRVPDVEMECHPSAQDMCHGKGSEDFRILMCAEVNMESLMTIHHEIGHIQYYSHYSHLPYAFREGANPGFHEAIGDSLALAVTTPKHLQCVLGFQLGLKIDCSGKDKSGTAVSEADINSLFHNALDLLVTPAFSMAVDDWRFKVFNGEIQEKDYNKKWWEIRQKYSGLGLPSPRDDSKFDPAAKYHIPGDIEYIRYTFSNFLQFSLYEAMCKAAGEYDPKNPKGKPLYQCDFSGNKAAGKLLSNMLRMGFKDPWPKALKAATGESKLSADSILNYFQPLFAKIDQDLKAANESCP